MASVLRLRSISDASLGEALGGSISLRLASGTTGLSSISDTTATALDGLLAGNGTVVSAVTVGTGLTLAGGTLTVPGGPFLPLTGGSLFGNLVVSGTIQASAITANQFSGLGNALTGLDADSITSGSITGTGAMVRLSAVGARYAGFIAAPTAIDYVLDPFTATATSRRTLPAISLGAGTLTAEIRVNGVAVTGWDAIAVTTSPQSVTLGSAVTWAAGAEVVLRLSSISGATGFRFSIPSEV